MMSPLDRNVEGICPAWVLDFGECLYVSGRAVAVKAAVNGVKTRECVLIVEKEGYNRSTRRDCVRNYLFDPRFSLYKVRYGNKCVYVFTSLTLYKGFYFGKQLSLKGPECLGSTSYPRFKAGRAYGDMGHVSVPGRSVLKA